jgi:elongation factor Ts
MDVDALLLSPLHSSVPTHNRSLKELLDDTVLSIRENLHIVQACSIHSPSQQAVISGYIHGKLSANTGTCAALVTLIPSSTCTLSREAVLDVGKKLSMHVVAAKPMYLSPKDIPQHVLDRERDIILEQMNQTPSMTKKRDIMDKIILGKMNKFHEQVCLTEQAHMVEEGNPKVAKYLQGLGLNVVSFCALSVH